MYTLIMHVLNPSNSLLQILGPSDGMLIGLSQYEDDKQAQSFLRDKRYSMKEIKDEVAYRVISHWCSMGLVIREKDNDWLKLSIVDLVWIKMIAKLRKFGFSLQAIDTIKKCVFYLTPEGTKLYHFLDLYIIYVLQKIPVGLFIDEKFEAVFCTEKMIEQAKALADILPSHLFLNLNEIVLSVFSNKELKPIYDSSIRLNIEEMNLLLHLRSGNYEEIKVRLKNGHIDLFEGKKKIDTSIRVIDLIKKAEYQDIEIKLVGGKVIKVTQTEKKKF